MLYYVIMWFLMSFFSYVSSTIAGAVARLEKGKKRRQEFVEGHSQGVWLCLFLRRSDTSRGGPTKEAPQKERREGRKQHSHSHSFLLQDVCLSMPVM